MNGRYFSHRFLLFTHSNVLLPMINDTTGHKVESLNDIAINHIDQ